MKTDFTLKYLTLISLSFLFIVSSIDAQQIYEMSNSSLSICDGQFTDDAGGGTYTDNNYTMTICPDNPGDGIRVNFVAFSLQTSPNPQNSDYLAIFDGDNTGAPSLGSYTGNQINGIAVAASVNNPTGCLTFQFTCNTGNTQGFPGWSGIIECATPCASPTSVAEILDPAPSGAEQTIGVCLDEPITFADNGSFAEPGFNLEQYSWNFDDGTIDTLSGPEVTHSFSEPGEYIVTLTVEDNNGCQSLNVQPLQVLVSTLPEFNTEFEPEICLGTTVTLDGTPLESVTWTALPPQVLGGEFYLADGPGFSFENSIIFDFFEDGAVLETCDDLLNVTLNMEHSYMGDLNISMTCPNGTTVTFLEYPNGGGGTFFGEAEDDPSPDVGVGYDYGWAPDAGNGTMGENLPGGFGGGILESGIYESDYDMCDFVGCPLNGEWILSIVDNLAADDGTIFEFGVNFNPALFPDVTTFTPVYGEDSDSSFWEGPFITELSDDGNVITALPEEEGVYDYNFFTTNNFGCTLDTTVSVEVTAMPEIQTIDDLSLCPGDIGQLGLGLAGEELPQCFGEGGTFEYCYTDNDNSVFTYCPDNPGDGVTFMSIEFLTGQVENFFDPITFYDGDNTGAPVIQIAEGDLTGVFVQAANPTGCITMAFGSDGSVSCGSGSFDPMEYVVACSSNLQGFDFAWTPETGLSDPGIYNPTVTIEQNTAYTVQAFPPGFPECATSDDINVTINPDVDPGQDSTLIVCFTDGPYDLFDLLQGSPVPGGVWTDAGGLEIDSNFDPSVDPGGEFTYTLDNNDCIASASIDITVLPEGDPACCEFDIEITGTSPLCFNVDNGEIEVNVNFTTGGGPWDISLYDAGNNIIETINSATGQHTFTDLGTGDYVIDVVDTGSCFYEEDVSLFEPEPLTFEVSADTTICIEGIATLIASSEEDPGDWEYIWDNGLPEGSEVQASPLEATTYSVFALTPEGCELDPLTVDVDLYESLEVTAISDTTLCDGGTVELGVLSSAGGFGEHSYEWFLQGASIGIGDTLEYEVAVGGDYCVQITDECETPPVSDCMLVDLEEPLDPQFMADVLDGCSPLEVVFTPLIDTSQVDVILWNDGNGFATEDYSMETSYQDPGLYDVSLEVTSIRGCDYQVTYPNYITVFNDPIASFNATPQPSTIPDSEIQFNEFAEGNVINYFWVFDTLNFLGTSFEPNPIFEFPSDEGAIYPVSLTVTNEFGCQDETVRLVSINDMFNVFVPNAFTPNGDGINDVFYVQGTDLDPDRYEIWIFSRWGEVVFNSKDINKVWTGGYGESGEYFLPDGVYNWRIVAHSLATTERKEVQGTVTLLR